MKNPIVKRTHGFFTLRSSLFVFYSSLKPMSAVRSSLLVNLLHKIQDNNTKHNTKT
nr:MAG TPA: hypothetical protein [Caudoviricetes sp.]